MKKNTFQREFKKLKGQINNIEEIVYHSKVGALIAVSYTHLDVYKRQV